MALYHCSENHYDLLVKNDSRLALLGLLAGSVDEYPKIPVSSKSSIEEWTTVKNKKRNVSKKDSRKKDGNEEQLLTEIEDNDNTSTNLDEEAKLAETKNNGFRRTGPQELPEIGSKNIKTNQCDQCMFEFQSSGILEAHRQTHRKKVNCETCAEMFEIKSDLDEHILNKHSENKELNQWNCNDCAFQANCASELMKHLKLTAHQPSKNVSDKRKVFEDYKQCYTCKMDFDGYINLMNHRKIVHPSNKKCRNFSSNSCIFGEECWYVHDAKDEPEENFDKFKCDQCGNELRGRANFMRHKKLLHPQVVPSCEKFSLSKCNRGETDCWFTHRQKEKNKNEENSWPKLPTSQPRLKTSEQPVFREVAGQAIPPDQLKQMMDMLSNLCNKVKNMEKQLEEMMN